MAGSLSRRPISVATFNINDINKRLPILLDWLAQTSPDIVCLQELKAVDERFPANALETAGYSGVWRGQKSWNGVAILSRLGTPVLTRDALPGDEADLQSRYIEAAVEGILVASIYLPNGNPQPGPKFSYKLAWFDRLIAHAGSLMNADVPAILAGDFNVAPTELDIYENHSYADNALVQPEARARFGQLLSQGWIDAIRSMHPDEPMFSFWHYMRNRFGRDAGLRLDHLLLSPALKPRLLDAGIDRQLRALPNASDHAPAWVLLRR